MSAPATTESIVEALRASEVAQVDLVKRLSAEIATFRNLTAELQLQNRHQAEVIERQNVIIARQAEQEDTLTGSIQKLLVGFGEEARINSEVVQTLNADAASFHAERPPLGDMIVKVEEPAPRPSRRKDAGPGALAAVEDALGQPEDDGAPIPDGIRRDRDPGPLDNAARAAAAILGLALAVGWPFLAGLA